VFLLYLSAILTSNFKSIVEGAGFAGLSPFPGFYSDNVGITFLVFFGALIGIIASVSATIFNKEKGKFGFSIGEKEEKGYSRWAKEQEIKKYKDVEKVLVKAEESNAAGVALINNGKEMYVDNGENHTLVIGATASGKTTAVVNPLVNSLAKKGESMIITDPKGEIYKEHSNYLKSKGYNVLVLNFRDPSMGSSWNPLSLPYLLYKSGNHDKSTELLDDVALNILIDPNSKADPFWEKSAADYFAGICLGLFEDATEEQININTVSYMATVGEEKFATSNYIKEYFGLKGEDTSAYTFASNTINAPQDTKGSILSVFRQKIRLFASKEDLSEMLSYTDFDLRNIGSEKTAIFMVIHDEKTTYHALATIFIKQCYETLVDFAYKQPNGQLPFKTNFILDEFANMPPLKDVTSMVTAARSRAIRFTFIIQNFAQLSKVYGKDDAETIKSNCGNLIYLITTELAALEEISKLCGDMKAKGKDAEKTTSVPLVSVSDLQRLKMNEVIILKTRLNPFKTKLTPSYKIDWGHNFDKAEFYERDKRAIQLFDLKEFVKEKKRSKLLETMNESPAGDPNQKTIDNSFNPYPMDMQMPAFNTGGSTMPSSSLFDASDNTPSLDEIVRQIDAQIAKLEKEEAEAKRLEQDNKPFIDNRKQPVEEPVKEVITESVKEPKVEQVVKEEPKIEEIKEPVTEKPVVLNVQEPVMQETIIPTPEDINEINKEIPKEEKPIVNVDADSVVVNNNYITDDQFFDDFFSDD
jgi:type IV secretion system protein VirD4